MEAEMKTRKLYIISLLIFFIFNSQIANADNICNAVLLSAIKTQYHHVKSGSYSEALYEATCSQTNNRGNSSLNLNIPDIAELSFSNSRATIRKACYEKNKTIFSQYSDEVVYSIMPKEALSIISQCIGGLFLKTSERNTVDPEGYLFTQDSKPDKPKAISEVIITATYIPPPVGPGTFQKWKTSKFLRKVL
jgi:hypothetical protein